MKGLLVRIGIAGIFLFWGVAGVTAVYQCSFEPNEKPAFTIEIAEDSATLRSWEELTFSNPDPVRGTQPIGCDRSIIKTGYGEVLSVSCLLWPAVYQDNVMLLRAGNQLIFEFDGSSQNENGLSGEVSQYEIPGNVWRIVDYYLRYKVECEQVHNL